MTERVSFNFKVNSDDFLTAGRVSSEIKKYLLQLGIDTKIIRTIAICAYEAEMNLVIHSLGGEIQLEISNEKIHLRSIDCGPGIVDLKLAMKEGYSTASDKAREMGFGAGMGLPNMKKNAEVFEISSSKAGTKIFMTYSIKQ